MEQCSREAAYTWVEQSEDMGIQIPILLRQSKFRLPKAASMPVVMVGPGTAVAPFCAFCQEGITQAQSGIQVGPMMLFFGCRSRSEDFLYSEEWTRCNEILGSAFELIVAFFREGPCKVYVQNKLSEQAKDVDTLLQQKATFYVCGDVTNMARAVNGTIVDIISRTRGISSTAAEAIVTMMRLQGHCQEDVWWNMFGETLRRSGKLR